MAGHYPGQFGPPAGGPAPGGADQRPPGRFGAPGRVLCCLAPLLTVGFLGVVPSLLLAVRRKRVVDVIGAVLFCLVFVVFLVSIALAGGAKHENTADTTGAVAMVLLWLGAPLHYLAMDRRALWPSPVLAVPAPYYQPVQPVQSAWYPPPTAPLPGAPLPTTGPPAPVAEADPYALVARYHAPAATPAPAAPVAPLTAEPPAAAPAPARTADDLQQLGELLRRQSREGRP
ncbi:hypothetical protein GCM10010495_41380 [Kitasatospora herbaricolor]|uniref:hypothetical protein n=1 Tax=Kitasatospora herbaricolor TaxID=68217 RepID=UPI00174C7D39|nr:hypothetical protein [Kitasatospora herbaricolor]MDQ0310299.1 hypothetical protein [Kitasatospora herbaricolor]GGV21514.1 hypothetical protein GCM10010495_41380 [Kitasatospora herbaricolor]